MASFDNEHTRGFAIALAAATVASFIQPQAIASAPQILGLVATGQPTPLNCSDGFCGAEFSSFCLQPERPAPTTGTDYRPSADSELTLIYARADGTSGEIDVTPYVAIDSRRSYAAVRIALPESLMEALGATSASLRVGSNASAVPASSSDSASAIVMAEIRTVTGALRQVAERLFDPESDHAVAAATAIQLVNMQAHVNKPIVLPESLQRCAGSDRQHVVGCLQAIHHANITQANIRVWDGLAEVKG
jgi:hypothetical protein